MSCSLSVNMRNALATIVAMEHLDGRLDNDRIQVLAKELGDISDLFTPTETEAFTVIMLQLLRCSMERRETLMQALHAN